MIRHVKFRSFDGAALDGTLTTPSHPRAAVLMMHGIPSDKNEWGFYSDMAKVLLENSIASLRFDFRGCGASEALPMQQLTLSAMINDIDAAYWELHRSNARDVPIHVVGTSCGGGVTVRWHNLLRRSIKKIYLMAPVLDYEFEVTGQPRSVKGEGESLLDDGLSHKLRDSGVVNDIGYSRAILHEAHLFDGAAELRNASCPVVIFQGEDDTVVPMALTRSIIRDVPGIELVPVDGADHGFAVMGDDDLTDPATKANHLLVYNEMLKRI